MSLGRPLASHPHGRHRIAIVTGMALVTALIAWGTRPGADLRGALLEAAPDPALAAWHLGWTAQELAHEGFRTVQVGFPTGGRVAPSIESVLLAPVTWIGGTIVAWNVLQALRVIAAVAGTAALLRRRGAHVGWALLAAVPVVAGAGGAMAWVPAALAILEASASEGATGPGDGVRSGRSGADPWSARRRRGFGLLAGSLLLASGPDTACAGALAMGILGIGRDARTRGTVLAAVVATLGVHAWVAGDPLDGPASAAWTRLTARAGLPTGTLDTLLGTASAAIPAGPRWGGPGLLAAAALACGAALVAAWRQARVGAHATAGASDPGPAAPEHPTDAGAGALRGQEPPPHESQAPPEADATPTSLTPALTLAVLGLALVMGPFLLMTGPDGEVLPYYLRGRQLPLPGLAVAWLPPFNAVASRLSWSILAWSGLALACGVATAQWNPGPRRFGALAVVGALVLGGLHAPPVAPWRVLRRDAGTGCEVRAEDVSVRCHPLVTGDGNLSARLLLDQEAGQLTALAPARRDDPVLALLAQEGWSLRGLQGLLGPLGFEWFRVLPDAVEAHAPELAWILGTEAGTRGAAVRGAPWPDVRFGAWDANHPPYVPPREAPVGGASDDWRWTDPALAPFLDLATAEHALVRVRMWTSADGQRWKPGPLVAHSLSSLGVTVAATPGQAPALVVTAMPHASDEIRRRFGQLHASTVVALTTTDLVNWGLRRVQVDRPLALVDPQLRWTPAGWDLLAWVRTGAFGVDPARLGGVHPVLRAHPSGAFPAAGLPGTERWRAEPPLFAEEGLADPTWLDDDRLAATVLRPEHPAHIAIWTKTEAGWTVTARIPGLTVPSAWRDGDGNWRIVGQDMRPGHLGEVAEVVSLDGGATWSPPRTLDELRRAPRCESPVVAALGDGYVLVCSER